MRPAADDKPAFLFTFSPCAGMIRKDLSSAIPTVRRWSQADVPKKLTPAEVDRILDTPDRKTATGRRIMRSCSFWRNWVFGPVKSFRLN